MSNTGVYPIDAASEVGKLRLLVSDTDGTEIAGQPGFAEYNVWSDDALQVALNSQGGNQLRAAGTLFLQLAAAYVMASRSIKTDDLAIDTKNRGADLHQVAQSFFDEATAAETAAANDFFQIVPFAGRAGRNTCVRPEGTPWPLIGGCA